MILVKSRDIQPPSRYNQYELTEPDMRPLIHTDHFRFRNIRIKGELTVPNFKSKRYGRNSIRGASIMTWNFFRKIFPEKDFALLKRRNLKNIITDYYI